MSSLDDFLCGMHQEGEENDERGEEEVEEEQEEETEIADGLTAA